MKIEDLTEVEAWGTGAYIGVGVHDVRVIRAEETTSISSGSPQIELELEAISGDEKGSTIRDWISVIPPGPETKGTLGKVKQFIEACGVEVPKGAFNLDVKTIEGHNTRIIVRKESGDEYPRVKGYSSSDIPLADESGMHKKADDDEKDLPF